jgi:hypothetical protein
MLPDYNIGMLPLAGTDDLTLNVRQFHAIWRSSLRIVDGIRVGPYDVSKHLRVSLDSLRFHLATCVAAIDGFIRSGGDWNDSAMEIPHANDYIHLYLQELLKAKALWNAWIDGESIGFSGVTTAPAVEDALIDTKPQTISQSMVFLAGGALIIGAIYLFRK